MCTVTFVPSGNAVSITHNRDEKITRFKALPPKQYALNGFRLLFPKDIKGGTWVCINNYGNAAALLNGGFSHHQSNPPYRKSRGLILLDIAASFDMLEAWQKTDLSGIEPFTLVLWNNALLFETRWDGINKHTRQLDEKTSHLWSSATLYEPEIVDKRKQWFDKWQLLHPLPSMNDIINFHRYGGEGDTHNDLCMNRDDCLLTVSISSLNITPGKGSIDYYDLQDESIYRKKIHFIKDPVENK